MMDEHEWIWVCRWEEFQHYAPERDRAPAWIKTYTKQLDDDRYTDLPPRARALLHDVRMAFARCSYRVRTTSGTLSNRVMERVYTSDLKLLMDAGFIEIVSRETLEQRLEQLYSSRAPARSKEVEVEEEIENTQPLAPLDTPAHQNGRDDIPLPTLRTIT